MKPVIKNSLLVVFGVIIGLLAGFLIFNLENKAIIYDKKEVQTKVITKEVKDTVYIEKEKIVEINRINDAIQEKDTLNFAFQDTLKEGYNQDTTELIVENDDSNAELQVFTDQLLSKVTIDLEKTSLTNKDSLDTEQIFDLDTEKFNSSIKVEYWSSPLDLTGYELNRNTLKLYGFNPDEPISLIYKEGESFISLKINDINLNLEKTERFKTLYF